MRIERRRDARCALREKTFAALGRQHARVGRIRDISRGGVAFDYVAGRHEALDEPFLDLFATDTPRHVHHIPCQVVYDVPLPAPDAGRPPAAAGNTRRCGVQFHSASEVQRLEIARFIQEFSLGTAR
jgi:hypothetical protein